MIKLKVNHGFKNIEMVIVFSDHRNANQNNPRIPLCTYQNDYIQRLQGTTNVVEDVEKEEHSTIAAGIANCYNHSGNHSGDSSEKWK